MVRRIGLTDIDSLFEDFLQEISECRPPDEHAVGSPGHDGVDMFDIIDHIIRLALR